MSARRRLLGIAAAALGCLALVPAAEAAVFCVNSNPCVGGTAKGTIQAALDDAALVPPASRPAGTPTAAQANDDLPHRIPPQDLDGQQGHSQPRALATPDE